MKCVVAACEKQATELLELVGSCAGDRRAWFCEGCANGWLGDVWEPVPDRELKLGEQAAMRV